jgi:hypothetical protein
VLKRYTYVFTSPVICCNAYVDCPNGKAYVDDTDGKACIVYAWYISYFSEHSECKGAKNACGNTLYSVMDYTFPVWFYMCKYVKLC